MKNVSINISASYETVGWKDSRIVITEEKNDEWKKKLGDVRADMGFLNANKAFRIMDCPLGTYYTRVIANPACSRGGFIQIAIFYSVGSKPTSAAKVIEVLGDIEDVFSNADETKKYFEGDADVVDKFKAKIREISNKLESKSDITIQGRKPFGTQSSKTVYRVSCGTADVVDFFENPHQDVTTEYKSVYLVDKGTKCADGATKIETPIQKIYNIVNGKDNYYVLEGNTCSVKLNSQPNMEPKTIDVIADGKSGSCYTVNGNTINVNETKVNFTRKFQVVLVYPKLKKDETISEFKLTVDDVNGDIHGKKYEENDLIKIKYDFIATLKSNKIHIDSKDVSLSGDSINPSKENFKEYSLNWAKRTVLLTFEQDDKPAKFSENTKVTLVGKKKVPAIACNDKKQTCYKATIEADQNYSVELTSEHYQLNDTKTHITINQRSYVIPVKNNSTTLSVNIGGKEGIDLKCNTEKINKHDKKYAGYSLKCKKNGEVEVKVVPSKWKVLGISLSVVSVLLLVSSFFLGYAALRNANFAKESTLQIDSLQQLVVKTAADTIAKDTTANNAKVDKVTTKDKSTLDSTKHK